MPAVLGIHAFGHDAGACIITPQGVWALSEERLSRRKYDDGFPLRSIEWVLRASGVGDVNALDLVVYDLCEMNGSAALEAIRAMGYTGRIQACRHHDAHAASAYFCSPFDDAAVLTIDAGGTREGESGPGVPPSILGAAAADHREVQAEFRGSGNRLVSIRRTVTAPPWNVNPAIFYAAGSLHLGFGPMGAGKLMGLAAYGAPEESFRSPVFQLFDGAALAPFPGNDPLREQALIEHMSASLGGLPPRRRDEPLTDRHANVAAYVQEETERAVLEMARHLAKVTRSPRLCFAGGFALNVTTNTALLEQTPFEELFVQPAATDTGVPLGCALFGYHVVLGEPRSFRMTTAALGGEFGPEAIEKAIARRPGLRATRMKDIARHTAKALASGGIVGWFQGRSELGPRALGHRSILADPRDRRSVERLNAEIKFREAFRPYAPMVLQSAADTCFELPVPSPFMLFSARVREAWRARLPAITHHDGTARVQTVAPRDEPRLAQLLTCFRDETDVPVLLNTSFNRDGEPIVETPDDALEVLLGTALDAVVLDDFWVERVAPAERSISF